MPFRIRRILLAVEDGSSSRAIRRVGDLATETGASVELFSVVRPDSTVMGLPKATLAHINREIAADRRRGLSGAWRNCGAGASRRSPPWCCTIR